MYICPVIKKSSLKDIIHEETRVRTTADKEVEPQFGRHLNKYDDDDKDKEVWVLNLQFYVCVVQCWSHKLLCIEDN